MAHSFLHALDASHSNFVSSLSSVPCRTRRYSPVSGFTVSTFAFTTVLLRIISPTFVRRLKGLVGAFSSVWMSWILKRGMNDLPRPRSLAEPHLETADAGRGAAVAERGRKKAPCVSRGGP